MYEIAEIFLSGDGSLQVQYTPTITQTKQ